MGFASSIKEALSTKASGVGGGGSGGRPRGSPHTPPPPPPSSSYAPQRWGSKFGLSNPFSKAGSPPPPPPPPPPSSSSSLAPRSGRWTGGSKFSFSSPFSKTAGGGGAPSPSLEERTVPPTPSPRGSVGGSSRGKKPAKRKDPALYDDFDNDDAQPRQREGDAKSGGRRACLCVTTLAVLGVVGYLTWKYALDEPTDWEEAREGFSDLDEKWDKMNFTNVLDSIEGLDFGDLFGSDPMEGDATYRTWPAEYIDGGLHLTLLNALDDTWQSEFDDAVSDWTESDALDLTVERVDVDYDCTRVAGVMVVCNANFGATGWVGINQNEIKDGIIMSSVAKMNEYYLRNADYDYRRFTMCHEIGHGFGLPHTDEDPYNEPLGNCLDYTDRPSMNIYPGDVNMDKLSDMYLSRRSRRVREDGTVVETTELVKR